MGNNLNTGSKFYGYSVAVGCAIIVFLTQGALGTFGVFFPYILESEGYSPTAVSLMATCCSTVVFIINTMFYSIVKRLGAKRTMMLGIFFCGLHYVIYGLSTSILMIYVGACFGGFSMGMATNAITSLILTRWFVEKRDAVIGYAMLPMSFGGAAMSFISGQLCELVGWRNAYFVVAALLWIIGLPICAIFVKESPEKYGQLPLGATEAVVDEIKAKDTSKLVEARTVGFWLMWIGLFLLCIINPGLSHNLSNVWRSVGIEPLAASNYTSIAKLLGALGFLAMGKYAEKIGGKGVTVFFGISCCLAPIVLLQSGHGIVWVALACIMYGLTYPSYHLTASYVTMDAYGRGRFARVFGVLQGAAMWAGAFSSLVVNGIKEAAGSTYALPMYIFAACGIVSMVLILAGMNLARRGQAKA